MPAPRRLLLRSGVPVLLRLVFDRLQRLDQLASVASRLALLQERSLRARLLGSLLEEVLDLRLLLRSHGHRPLKGLLHGLRRFEEGGIRILQDLNSARQLVERLHVLTLSAHVIPMILLSHLLGRLQIRFIRADLGYGLIDFGRQLIL
jgi:hypothetical protein